MREGAIKRALYTRGLRRFGAPWESVGSVRGTPPAVRGIQEIVVMTATDTPPNLFMINNAEAILFARPTFVRPFVRSLV